MNKLFKLKQWLNIDETAHHLSSILGETVEKKDIFRLALDGHLSLSVDFVNHTQARLGNIVGIEDVEWYELPDIFTPDELKEKTDKPIRFNISELINQCAE